MKPELKVGSVPYLVGRPLDLGLGDEPGVRLEHAVPAQLVERLRSGAIDVAMVSSIELFRRPGYSYIDGIAVAGRGKVGSVQVFLRAPLAEVTSIAMDPDSRAAQALCKTMLANRPGGAPEFLEVAHGMDPRQAPAEAWLRIGDGALREHHVERLPFWNPSEAWAEATGLPFVFAPWIVRPGVDLAPHVGAFQRAFERGTAALDQLAADGAQSWGLSESTCREYLQRECTYQLGSREMRQCLFEFRDRAGALGLCETDFEPQPISPAEQVRPQDTHGLSSSRTRS